MEPESSLPFPQKLDTCPYASHLIKIYFNIMIPSTLRSSKWILTLRFPHQNSVHPSVHLPAYEDKTECSETSAYKIQAPGNYPEKSTQHSEPGESLKSIK